MVQNSKVKITVVKTLGIKELFGSEALQTEEGLEDKCPIHKVGQEFLVDIDGEKPEGFCAWAWNDIYRDFTHIRFGGSFPWMKEKGVNYNSCSDGLRPGIFRIERIEE